jgi:hypothetical protein
VIGDLSPTFKRVLTKPFRCPSTSVSIKSERCVPSTRHILSFRAAHRFYVRSNVFTFSDHIRQTEKVLKFFCEMLFEHSTNCAAEDSPSPEQSAAGAKASDFLKLSIRQLKGLYRSRAAHSCSFEGTFRMHKVQNVLNSPLEETSTLDYPTKGARIGSLRPEALWTMIHPKSQAPLPTFARSLLGLLLVNMPASGTRF